jgi:hypothetical protein
MLRFIILSSLLLAATTAFAQTPSDEQSTPMYPAQPPKDAPKTEQGVSLKGLTSPLDAAEQKFSQTAIASDAEAALLADAHKLMWGRFAKVKGSKPGEVEVTKKAGLWSVKGRIEGTVPGTEGDWAAIDAVVERIAAGYLTMRGEVAFRSAKVQDGKPCKAAGTLHFKRSGKSQVWRLVEDDNPCDGSQELFDLIHDKAPAEKKPAEKKPVPAARKS